MIVKTCGLSRGEIDLLDFDALGELFRIEQGGQ
jgi:hypothetical protein